ncbi:MAG: hypothetical protein LBS41_01610 [Streptococcaceae bacterium]|jgi:putative peptide transport system permease protein|nr:hypothetical protein [Streptococcaceae bacterium]
MFRIEMKKIAKSTTLSYFALITTVVFVLGWALPVGLDHVSNLSIGAYLYSTYTVVTQFGFLLYGFGIVNFFNKDYAEKTIMFYHFQKIPSIRYFVTKIAILDCSLLLLNFLALSVTALIFHDFSLLLGMSGLLTIVFVQYSIVVGIFALLFSNMLSAIGSAIAFWLISVICVTTIFPLNKIAYFDASNQFYIKVEQWLNGNGSVANNFPQIIVFIGILLIIGLIVAKLNQNQWLKNGVM